MRPSQLRIQDMAKAFGPVEEHSHPPVFAAAEAALLWAAGDISDDDFHDAMEEEFERALRQTLRQTRRQKGTT